MLHPFLTARARQQAATEYAEKNGVTFFRALRTVRNIDDGDMNVLCLQAADEAKVALPSFAMATGMTGSFGDGHIIQAIIAWLKSPEGQAFIQMLIKLIIGLLMGL